MDPGSLNKKILIQTLITRNESGSLIGDNWTTVIEQFGSVEPVNSQRALELGKITHNKYFDITIRGELPLFDDTGSPVNLNNCRILEYTSDDLIKRELTVYIVDEIENDKILKITAYEKI